MGKGDEEEEKAGRGCGDGRRDVVRVGGEMSGGSTRRSVEEYPLTPVTAR